jgi:S1-C subfamily serine protease
MKPFEQEKDAMAAKRKLTTAGRRTAAVALSLAVVFALAWQAASARADVRESVKRALPATVHVEWHDEADKTTPASQVVPPRTGVDALDSYRGLVRTLAVQQKRSPDQVNMASGTIVSADGLVVTMVGAREDGKYSVTFGDGKSLAARLLVDDRRTGLKLLKVDSAGLPFLNPVQQPPQIGEEVTWTYCLGPKERAAARGIVAATGRELPGMGTDLLQLDAGVAIGSAGAPLVDDQGRLLGIIAFGRIGESQRIGYAIPASAVQALFSARRGDGPAVVQRGMLGISLSRPGNEGPIVAHPIPDSPAAAAGILDGDEVLAIDGVKVGSPEETARLVGKQTAGQKVKVSIRRADKEQEIDVTLAPAQAPVGHPPVALPIPASGIRSALSGGGGGGALPGALKGGTPASPAAPVHNPPGVTAVRPDALYIFDAEGKLQALPIPADDKSFDQLRKHYDALYKAQHDAAVSVPSIQVQRSDLDKKLEAIGRDVLTLRQQMEKLTEELQRLQKQLSGSAAKP